MCCRIKNETVGWLQESLCSSVDVTEGLAGRGLPRLVETIEALCRYETTEPTAYEKGPNDTTVSFLLIGVFVMTVIFLYVFPPPN